MRKPEGIVYYYEFVGPKQPLRLLKVRDYTGIRYVNEIRNK